MKSSRPGQVKRLTADDVPESIRPFLDFSDQILIPQADKSNRLFIAALCSECDCHFYRRVSDLKAYITKGTQIVWLCAECRKSERWPTPAGYMLVYRPDHPNAQASGQMFEHVFVMSEMIGRPLTKDENVHHKNGSRSDNRPENLELWSVRQPQGQRIDDKIRWAIELKDLYPKEWKRVRARMLRESK